MINEVFELYYTTNMHPARLLPLSKEELSIGMPVKAIEQYLALIERLYNILAFDVNEKRTPPSKEEQRQSHLDASKAYNDIIKLLFTHDAISDDTFCELHKCMPIEFGFIEHPNNSNEYVADTLDDFRLAFELSILEHNTNIQLAESYLDDRYGYAICVKPGTTRHWIDSSDLQIIRFEKESADIKSVEVSYWEAQHLLKRIEEDIKLNDYEQERLDAVFCPFKRKGVYSFEKWTYAKPKNITEWYTMKRALMFEQNNLEYLRDDIKNICECMQKPDETVGTGATLYIYKGNISCHQKNHPIVPATAILFDGYGNEIQLDVEFCPVCNRYLLNYVSFVQYREKHSVLIGKLKMVVSTGTYGELSLAPESPLKLCGYNVAQTNGLSDATRQYILAKIIHDGIMKKTEVIRYLEHFINLNGSKKENVIAAQKWCEDLDFVHKYNIETQPKTYVDKIVRY